MNLKLSLLFISACILVAWLVKGTVGDRNGGTKCAACTVVVGLVEQLSQIYNETIAQSMARACSYLPSDGFQEACKFLVDEFGPVIIESIEANETPDIACQSLGICTYDKPSNMCVLFPLPKDPHLRQLQLQASTKRAQLFDHKAAYVLKEACDNPILKPICDLINKFGNDHDPLEDADGDRFSVVETFRGTSWRGKDCDDFDKSVYPGRRPRSNGDSVIDSNCNGILGIDASTGKTYEDQWCNGTGQMGVVVLGDSVGAHFHIPPEYLTSKDINIDTYSDLLFALENEFDWPMLSMTTGHFNTSRWKKSISGPMDSFYKRLLERNRCNHRDYQNIGVNGARVSAMNKTIARSLSRNQHSDYPLFIILELVGNDVCNGHPGTDHMTKPQEFHDNYKSLFEYLDTVLPKGSFVFVSGIVDGRVLYEFLYNRIHPIGSLRNDVTYSQLYDYLNCLEISPCFGWMNSNESWRNATADRMNQLNVVLTNLVANTTYKNFKLYNHDLSTVEVIKYWESQGGHPWDLIEPVDGFHPNQIANALTTNITWNLFQQKFPDAIPPINPHNEDIVKKFGDQGGY